MDLLQIISGKEIPILVGLTIALLIYVVDRRWARREFRDSPREGTRTPSAENLKTQAANAKDREPGGGSQHDTMNSIISNSDTMCCPY